MGIEHSRELRGGKEAGQTGESQCLAARPSQGFTRHFHTLNPPTPSRHQIPTPWEGFQSCNPARNMRQGWNTKSARTGVSGDEPDLCKSAKTAY